MAASFNKRAFKYYVIGVRMVNLPNVARPTRVLLRSVSNCDEQDRFYIKNIRIAKGAVPLYDRLLSYGKITSYAIIFTTGKADLKPESMVEIVRVEKFLRNLVLGEKNELKNRFLHVGFQTELDSKSKFCTLNCTLEELAVLRFLKGNPKATQEQIAKHLGRSERTIKSMTVRLTEKEYLIRKNGKRDGWWEVLVELPVT